MTQDGVAGAVAWCELQREIPRAIVDRVLLAADLRCAVCGVEDNRTIWRRYTQWADPMAWVLYTAATAAPPTWDSDRVIARVVVWGPSWPCELEALRALCMGCVIRTDVDAARA